MTGAPDAPPLPDALAHVTGRSGHPDGGVRVERRALCAVVRGATVDTHDPVEVRRVGGEVALFVRAGGLWLVLEDADGLLALPTSDAPTRPPLAAWLHELSAPAWLATAVRDHDARDAAEAHAGAGLLARLWFARDVGHPEGPRALLLVRAHARALSTPDRLALLAHALRAADALTRAVQARPHARHVAALLVRRDDLESHRVVLRAVGLDPPLVDALAHLDAAFASRTAPPDDGSVPRAAASPARWRAVCWLEPDAWWGPLLAGS